MPTVPNLEEGSVQAEPLPGRPYPRLSDETSAADFGGGIARGLEEVGAAGSGEEATLKRQNDQLRVIDANTQLEAAKTRMLYGQDGKGGAFALHGTDAINMPDRLMPVYDQTAQKIQANLTPDQQRLFAGHISLGRGELNTQLNRYEYEESNRLANEVFTNGVEQTVTNATTGWRDPAVIMKSRLDLKGLVSMQGDREGWSPDQRAEATQKALASMHSSVVDQMLADENPKAAQGYFNQIKDSGELSGQQALALGTRIDAKLKEHDNERKQDIADRYQDSIKAAEFGLPGAVTVSRSEMDQLYPKDAQRRWDGLQSIVAAGGQARLYDKMPIDAVLADVKGAEPTHGGPEATFAIEGYDIRARAAQRSIEARQRDPAQFAIDNGGWKPIDFKDPKAALSQLTSRANTQEQTAEQIGMTTPLLSKPEQKAFTGWLANQAPDQRLKTLGAIRTAMPSESAYGALLHQIAPDSPITAMAGAVLDRPSTSATPSWYDQRFARDPIVGQRMLEGEAILKDKGEKGIKSSFPMPADKDLQTQFQAAIGGSNSDLFRGRDQTLDATYAAYKATYAAMASHAGHTNGILDSDMAREAAESVVGYTTIYGHSNISIPAGMDPTHFEGAVNTASKIALKGAGYSASDIEALRGYGLRERGDTLGTGKYFIIDGKGDPLKSKDRTYSLEVDLNRQFSGPNAPAIPPPARRASFAGKGGSAIAITPQVSDGT